MCRQLWLFIVFAICTQMSMSLPMSNEGNTASIATTRAFLSNHSGIAIRIPINGTGNNNPANSTVSGYVDGIKGINSSLAGLAVLLVVTTYVVLIRCSAPLFDRINIPSDFLKKHIETILDDLWVRSFWRPQDRRANHAFLLHVDANGQSFCETLDEETSNVDITDKNGYRVMGIEDAEELCYSLKPNLPPFVWIQVASSAMRHAVQLAIWEWVGIFLATIMITGTLVLNGFIHTLVSPRDQPSPDRVLRLALISFHVLAYLVHFLYAWVCFCQTYTFIALQACWSTVFEYRFAVPRSSTKCGWWRNHNSRGELVLRTLDVSVLGSTRILKTYRSRFGNNRYVRPLKGTSPDAETLPVESGGIVCESDEEGPTIIEQFSREQEACIKNFEKATESALERVAANITIMLGICVVTGFSTWTGKQLVDAKDTQLGSFALLVSVGTGIGTLLTSASYLSSMSGTAKQILKISELVFGLQCRDESPGMRPQDSPYVGFTVADANRMHYRWMAPYDLWKSIPKSQWIWSVIFGPAFAFFPSRDARTCRHNELRYKVGDYIIQFSKDRGLVYRIKEKEDTVLEGDDPII